MNIDEFIEHTQEKAREHKYHADFFESDNPMNTACIKSAEDCEQLARWLEKSKEYQQLEERLNRVYGDCDGLLLSVIEMLEKHPNIDMANNTLKSRLLTDEDIDKWEEYKQLEEQDILVKLPCRVGDTVYGISMGKIITLIVNEISIFYMKGERIINVKCQNDDVFRNYVEREFGKTVFLTKPEAEAKLKELRGSNEQKKSNT